MSNPNIINYGIPYPLQQAPNQLLPGGFKTAALWTWTNTGGTNPSVQYYNNMSQTKTGLTPNDLQNFIGVPTVINSVVYLNGVPISNQTPVPDSQLMALLRQAEDWVETESGILLAQAWIASPPVSPAGLVNFNMQIVSPHSSGQIQGVDFDLIDSGYDFFYRRFISEGWGVQQLRYRPLKSILLMSFIYPLLSEFFSVPRTWIVEDWDAAFLRIVPSVNVQMLPLFAMQLAFMGFAQSLPQGLYLQYVAGLSPTDYQTRWGFMRTLVLSTAAVYLLNILQGSINFGMVRQATSVDGLRYDQSWPSNGAAYSGLIQNFAQQRDALLRTAVDLVRGVIAWVSL